MPSREDTLILFDVDGTLTVPRLSVTQEMRDTLKKLRDKVTIGIVGGSDLVKQIEQLGETVLEDFDYVFSENGLVAFHEGKQIGEESFSKLLGENALKELVNFTLLEFSKVDIPIKRGTFIEYRKGMLNMSPIGRNCSQKEREEFYEYDKIHKVREQLTKKFEEKFGNFTTDDKKQVKLRFAIGGQISFDAFPEGWDKTYCLRFVEGKYKDIHFFGDKTMPGGNDYEIYTSPKVTGHSVESFHDTIKILNQKFLQ
jgi:phosphomannomutase